MKLKSTQLKLTPGTIISLIVLGLAAVSYTHLTLPTNREV